MVSSMQKIMSGLLAAQNFRQSVKHQIIELKLVFWNEKSAFKTAETVQKPKKSTK
jgi:hypothetical protein